MGLQNAVRRCEDMFFEIVARTVAIDNQKIGDHADRHQRVMPDIAAVVHPLVGTRQEDLRPASTSSCSMPVTI